jgi:hypothetical protein
VAVDVETRVVIDRPRNEVAAYAADPDNAMRWYANIKAVEWETPRPVQVGARIAFVARFLGRRVYVYEVTELTPGERLVMATSDGPFPMETTYLWEDAGPGSTTMTLRNRGGPSEFPKFVISLIACAVRRANRKDLRRLRNILERLPDEHA